MKKLFDAPDEARKLHKRLIPTIGGIILFAATVFSFALWFPIDRVTDLSTAQTSVNDFKYIIATVLILFFVGIKDDIIGTAPSKKLLAHLLVASILVFMGDIRLRGLHGLFGIYEIPDGFSYMLSLFTYIVVVNAFNLIDGIDGLATGIGLICCVSFGLWFFLAGDLNMAVLAFALAGSLLAFLFFNFSPAKIFMGDSGSLTIGLIICIMAIKLVEFDGSFLTGVERSLSKPIFAMAVLVYPLIDTLRIFIYRTIRGKSPFSADRNHIHHQWIDLNFNHRQTALLLYTFNLLIIALSLVLKGVDSSYTFFIIASVVLLFAEIPFLIKNIRNVRRPKKHPVQINGRMPRHPQIAKKRAAVTPLTVISKDPVPMDK